jgi:hypothetical protein
MVVPTADPRLPHVTSPNGLGPGPAAVDLPLELPVVFRKTARGQHEIETRAARLLPRLRNALILVDGKRSDLELGQLLPQGHAALATLAEQGFIEAVAPLPAAKPSARPLTPKSSTAPSAAAVHSAPAPLRNDFEARRRQVLRAFTDCVGPAGDALAIKLEKARTLEDFRAQLHQAVNMVDMLRGRSQAQAFAARLDDF